MAAFINQYVVQREIPIPKLLYAFGVCLVGVPFSRLFPVTSEVLTTLSEV